MVGGGPCEVHASLGQAHSQPCDRAHLLEPPLGGLPAASRSLLHKLLGGTPVFLRGKLLSGILPPPGDRAAQSLWS